MITNSGTFYTLRCYLNDEPIFLGRNGRISVFGSERALARYLADEHDHDLADLSTYDDIRTAATDGSLRIDITDDNIYVFTGLADDLEDGVDEVDRDQLELAVELLTDVAEYSEDDSVDAELDSDTPAGQAGRASARAREARRTEGPVRRRRRTLAHPGAGDGGAAAARIVRR